MVELYILSLKLFYRAARKITILGLYFVCEDSTSFRLTTIVDYQSLQNFCYITMPEVPKAERPGKLT